MRNKLTIQLLAIAVFVIAVSVSGTFAQSPIRLDSSGRATLRGTAGANGKYTWRISGKDFTKLQIKQTSGAGLRYEAREGSQVLVKGETTGATIWMTSDRKSVYTFTLVNNTDKPETAAFSVVNRDK